MTIDMKTIQYAENSDDFVSVLKMTTTPVPKAAPGLAIVKVVAAASNPIDFKVRHNFIYGINVSSFLSCCLQL